MKRTAIVTGGTKGIGRAIAEMLLREDYAVTATYAHDEESAQRCREEWKKLSSTYEIVKCNQANAEEVSAFTKTMRVKCPHLDCLVCNAGTTLRKCLTGMTNEEWESVMQVNVNSHVYMIRDLYDNLILPPPEKGGHEGHSSIVLIGSLMAIHPHAMSLAYGVTKSAVHALATNLVKCFEGKPVNVNAIAPGFVETEWQKTKSLEVRNNIYNKTALRRFATVEEVADAVRFCIHNPFVNGSVIEVSGGYSYK